MKYTVEMASVYRKQGKLEIMNSGHIGEGVRNRVRETACTTQYICVEVSTLATDRTLMILMTLK
jgi:hypothetical protein